MRTPPWRSFLLSLIIVLFWMATLVLKESEAHDVDCKRLYIGQFLCPEPTIDFDTQQVAGCSRNNTAKLVCKLDPDLTCISGSGLNASHFIREIPCEWTNGYSFEFSLILSVFLGMFGIDRLYLGYPGLALAKFCTLGGMFLWQLVDIILIAMQVVRPADGSQYVVPYFGQRLIRLVFNNETQIIAQSDW